ncbi:MAG TPA: DNA topoisomerase IB [Tahibacter sp.]|uniref:DNA topoisomerase IB n=1 Tax=Tahibacter sp. TaxID=2056211 RepID=UPI002B804440|nr:DNA topoisomerase IB [Tahibacter sp.]HSX60220.1 DNA topoisomerase IB [Tahibacter sp.]
MPAARPTRPRLPASLRYVSDAAPGIRRRRRGSAFVYLHPGGRRIDDPRVLERIRKLAIPPAYRDVWICLRADGHLQATGRDARGRKQYRYHAHFRAFRENHKYALLADFAAALPRLRRRVQDCLKSTQLTRDRVVAAVVSLLDRTLIRVGNEEYARSNSSYGLTTLRDRHARVSTRRIALRFRGKTGKPHHVVLSDARLARIVRRCQELPGQLLFQYVGSDGRPHPLRSTDVNAFLAEHTGLALTARTFRTWGATAALVRAWQDSLAEAPDLAATPRLKECIARVASRLGNTAAVCRNSYLDPRVVDALVSGGWEPCDTRYTQTLRGLNWEERCVRALITKAIRRAQ